jgi:glutathione S-transferase
MTAGDDKPQIVEPEPIRPEYPVLWQMRISHFNEKARWALDYKQIPHRRRSLTPGLHPRGSKKAGGRGTTPVLKIDGQVLGDSTSIIAGLESRKPDPPLYPDTEIDRNAALDLEDHFDEQLGPGLRSAFFHAMWPNRKLTVALFTQGLAPVRRFGWNAGYPLIRHLGTRNLPSDDAAAQRGREQTIAAMDLIEEELEGDYLVGDRFSVADLTAAALLFPLVAPPQFAYWLPDTWPDEWEQFRRLLSGRRAYQWALEMFARHRGTSAAVSDD